MNGECCGESSILPDHDSGLWRKERAKGENQQIEVSDAGQDEVGADPPDEAEHFEGAVTDAGCTKFVNGDGCGQDAGVVGRARDQGQMDIVLIGIERPCEGFDDALGSAATKVRNEEENHGVLRRRHSLAMYKVARGLTESK